MTNAIDQQTAVLDALGRPLADLRISVTDRCNFNCNYCLPNKHVIFLPQKELLSFEEITRFVDIASQFGVKKIKLTGGEPTLRVGIDLLIKALRRNTKIEDIGLITNGMFLKSIGYRLKEAGLDRISVSLDAIDNRVFQNIIGNNYHVHPVLEGIEIATQLGFSPIKINCVIQKGINEQEILPLVRYFRKPHVHLRFIEFMDVGNIHWKEDKVLPSHDILHMISSHYDLVPMEKSYRGEVASRYRHSDGQGEIGFISSVSNPFCRDCTRLRLSCDGKLFSCLFSDRHLDIKDILRNADDEALKKAVQNFWTQRTDRYSEQRSELQNRQSREDMHFMGG